jgi:acyl-[acyl-carrier-protein]-phospholipid O-acyltransferase/long-chain-fatty-acid--[acyl-carrier-protein] ligase
MIKSLLGTKRFAPLFWCQFFSAFNDNFIKNGFVALVLFVLARQDSGSLVQLAGAALIAPFFAVRPRRRAGRQIRQGLDRAAAEICRDRGGRYRLGRLRDAHDCGLRLAEHSLLLLAIGLFGVIAALFGPIKYGILPDHLKREELPTGNALIEGATFWPSCSA